MDETTVRPEKGQRTIWYIGWAVPFGLIFLVWLVLLLVLGEPVFGMIAAAWIIISLPFLSWIPAYFRSLEYSVTGDAVKGKKGVFWKKFVTMPYHKITNVDITQGPLQRKFNVGTIHCQTAGAGGQQGGVAELKMEGLRDLDGLKEAIMERVKGSSMVGTGTARPKVAAPGESDTLGQMLKELRGIREVLERNR